MRRPALFSLSFLAATFLSVSPKAQSVTTQDVRFEVLAAEEKVVIDRIAADFYERDLRRSQTDAIEEATATSYVSASPEGREAFREERRAEWRALSDRRRAALRSAEAPRYDNLTAEQKAPFRRHALNRLEAAGAIDDAALADALEADI